MVDAALERARAYADAGANGFFVPVLHDLRLLERLCAASPLRSISWPGRDRRPLRMLPHGVARVSHGPFPHKAAMQALTDAAAAEFADRPLRSGRPSLLAWPPSRPGFAIPRRRAPS